MRLALATAILVVTSACSSTTDEVCSDVGDCSQGGSSAWVDSCESEATTLQEQADSTGCGQVFDSYYSCASASFQCSGATSTFPGCEAALSALDHCLATTEAATSCATLASRESACSDGGAALEGGAPEGGAPEGGAPEGGAPEGAADGGATGPLALPPACTTLRDCEAACYLAQVSDVCAPRVDELQGFASCAASCPVGL